jgi:DUF4097 and DUF4098 domain-containing protein YvlB
MKRNEPVGRPSARAARQLATAALLVALAACGPIASAQANVDRRLAADPRGSVVVTNVAGSLVVTGWDRPEIVIAGTLGRGVERLDVQQDGKRTVIKVMLPSGSVRDGAAQLRLSVPAGSALELSAVSAGVTVSGMAGRLSVRSVSGKVEAETSGTEIEVKSVSGDVRAAMSATSGPGGATSGSTRVSSVSGDVRLQVAGRAEVTTVSGTIEATIEPLAAARLRTTSGDVELAGAFAPTGSVEVESVSGSFTLRSPGPGGFVAEASSFSGDIETCFGARPVATDKYGPGRRLDATVGKGEGRVRVKSMSGDVSLCNRAD